MMKRMIFHVPLKLREGYVSGSTIRPQKMMEAFRSLGYEVDAIWGTSSERKIKIEEIKSNIESGAKYDFLYAENSTVPRLIATDKHHVPRHPFVDGDFFAYLKKKKIPMGIFYRDMYWKYPDAMKNLSWWKRKLIIALQKQELAEYEQLFDVLFLPSMRCLKPLGTKFSGTISSASISVQNSCSNDDTILTISNESIMPFSNNSTVGSLGTLSLIFCNKVTIFCSIIITHKFLLISLDQFFHLHSVAFQQV